MNNEELKKAIQEIIQEACKQNTCCNCKCSCCTNHSTPQAPSCC